MELQGQCHCGAIRITLPSLPDKATRCNCSACRRLGAVWVYFEPASVAVEGSPEHADGYAWGDKSLRFVRCRHCGVPTHWEPLARPGIEAVDRMGINLNNFSPALQAAVPVRRFDGAETWTFID
jgi:hypothetical protein